MLGIGGVRGFTFIFGGLIALATGLISFLTKEGFETNILILFMLSLSVVLLTFFMNRSKIIYWGNFLLLIFIFFFYGFLEDNPINSNHFPTEHFHSHL